MSLRRILFLVVALFASASTIVLGRMWLQAERASMVADKPADKSATAVLVAKGNIPAGHFVRPENLRWQPWPEGAIAPSYVVSGQHKLEDYVGAVVRIGLSDGEPITDARVVRPGDRGFLAAVLTPGYRAVTVNVTPSSGIAGFVFPGDRVDLVGTFRVQEIAVKGGPPAQQRFASETVLGDLRVLAVDQRVDDQSKDVVVAKTATLEVTPKQAEIIAVTAELGKFSLSLRSLAQNELSAQPASARAYTWDSEAARMLPPPSLGGAGHTITVYHGGLVTDVEISGRVR